MNENKGDRESNYEIAVKIMPIQFEVVKPSAFEYIYGHNSSYQMIKTPVRFFIKMTLFDTISG